MVFPTFFNLSLNLAIRSSWSEPQSAPGLVFADCIEFLHLWLERIESIWFQYWLSSAVHVYSLLLCCWKRVFVMTSAFSWQNPISLYPASFCSPRPNLPVTPGISWLSTFAFQFPIMKMTPFLVLVLDIVLGLYMTSQLQPLWHQWLGLDLNYCDVEWFALEMKWDHSVVFETAPSYCISDSFVDYEGYSISSKGFLHTVVNIMVIWIKFAHSHPF